MTPYQFINTLKDEGRLNFLNKLDDDPDVECMVTYSHEIRFIFRAQPNGHVIGMLQVSQDTWEKMNKTLLDKVMPK